MESTGTAHRERVARIITYPRRIVRFDFSFHFLRETGASGWGFPSLAPPARKFTQQSTAPAMRRSKIFFVLLALSLLVSLELVPSCRASEIDAEDDADDDDMSDAAISADEAPAGLVGQLLGVSRRFLYSPRMLSCRSDCEDKNKKCNTDYSECKRENKDDEHDHKKCTKKYKKCKKKIKKCRSKCD
ncbi:unnamed protein product [Closterium sp. Yama58-4]|nr:unnamed protein product [Closterium sp. Yama58-4]